MISPFTSRYNDPGLDKIWTKKHWADLITNLWKAQLIERKDLSLSTADYLGEMVGTPPQVMKLAEVYEEETHHELVALLMAFSKMLPSDAAHLIHLGMTSSDAQDFADLEMIKESVEVVLLHLRETIVQLQGVVIRYAHTPVIGRTHLQAAEPTTLGLRLAVPLEQLCKWAIRLQRMHDNFPTKGIRGAVGTMANTAMADLMEGKMPGEIPPGSMLATGQTYPRQIDLRVGHTLSDIACTLHKLSVDMRLMATEPYAQKSASGVGSSAMPGKVNPQNWEKVTGLSRLLPDAVSSLWHMAASSLMERTLDDSSSRRVVLPQMFYVISECLRTTSKELARFTIDEDVALFQVWEMWRAWLPSRLLTYRQLKFGTKDRMTMHSEISELAANPNFAFKDFMALFGEKESTNLLLLGYATKMAQNTCTMADLVIRMMDKK